MTQLNEEKKEVRTLEKISRQKKARERPGRVGKDKDMTNPPVLRLWTLKVST